MSDATQIIDTPPTPPVPVPPRGTKRASSDLAGEVGESEAKRARQNDDSEILAKKLPSYSTPATDGFTSGQERAFGILCDLLLGGIGHYPEAKDVTEYLSCPEAQEAHRTPLLANGANPCSRLMVAMIKGLPVFKDMKTNLPIRAVAIEGRLGDGSEYLPAFNLKETKGDNQMNTTFAQAGKAEAKTQLREIAASATSTLYVLHMVGTLAQFVHASDVSSLVMTMMAKAEIADVPDGADILNHASPIALNKAFAKWSSVKPSISNSWNGLHNKTPKDGLGYFSTEVFSFRGFKKCDVQTRKKIGACDWMDQRIADAHDNPTKSNKFLSSKAELRDDEVPPPGQPILIRRANTHSFLARNDPAMPYANMMFRALQLQKIVPYDCKTTVVSTLQFYERGAFGMRFDNDATLLFDFHDVPPAAEEDPTAFFVGGGGPLLLTAPPAAPAGDDLD